MSEKTIKSLHPALRDDIGDLLTQRPLRGPNLEQIDPFLFLAHHGRQTYAGQPRCGLAVTSLPGEPASRTVGER